MNNSMSAVPTAAMLLLLIVIPATSLAQATTVPPSQNAVLLDRGLALLSNDKLDSAQMVFEQLTSDKVRDSEPQLFIRAQLNIGRIYGDKGDNVTALQHYQEALQGAEKLNDKHLIAPILKNIGVLYISWKKFDKALEYYDNAETIARELDDQELIADCQNNKGIVYEQLEQYDKAIQVY
jgi:tetratricopeptide (TPR) repeat protein